MGKVLTLPPLWDDFGWAAPTDGRGVSHAFAITSYLDARVRPVCGKMRRGVSYVHEFAFPRMRRCRRCASLLQRIDAGELSLNAVMIRGAARNLRLTQVPAGTGQGTRRA